MFNLLFSDRFSTPPSNGGIKLSQHEEIKQIASFVSILLCILLLPASADAIERIWSGSGNASIATNWSGDQVPAEGDDVVFNDPSSGDCDWNIPASVKINSFSLDTGYNSTVSLSNNLNVGIGGIHIASGKLAAGSMTIIELEGNWFYFNGTHTFLGDVYEPIGIVGENDPLYTIDGSDASTVFNMIRGIDPILYCSDINKDGNVDILDVVLTLRKANELDNPYQECSGGFFDPGTSTVKLTGTNQVISGDTFFYNLEKIASCPGDTLTFEEGSLQTILGRLTLEGSAGCMLTLDRQGTDYWYLDPRGTRNISYVSINNLYNISNIDIIITNSDPDNSNNNKGLSFGGSKCVCLEDRFILAKLMCGGLKGECK